MIAFSIERLSAGSPSFFHVNISDSLDKKFLKLKSGDLKPESHPLSVFSLTVSFAELKYVK
jgi:hypothetical protein